MGRGGLQPRPCGAWAASQHARAPRAVCQWGAVASANAALLQQPSHAAGWRGGGVRATAGAVQYLRQPDLPFCYGNAHLVRPRLRRKSRATASPCASCPARGPYVCPAPGRTYPGGAPTSQRVAPTAGRRRTTPQVGGARNEPPERRSAGNGAPGGAEARRTCQGQCLAKGARPAGEVSTENASQVTTHLKNRFVSVQLLSFGWSTAQYRLRIRAWAWPRTGGLRIWEFSQVPIDWNTVGHMRDRQGPPNQG